MALLAELTLRTVDQLLARTTSRDEGDYGLAQLNYRLIVEESTDRLLSDYFEFDADDLMNLSPPTHQWILDVLSRRGTFDSRVTDALQNVYLAVPDPALRHSIVGILVEAEDKVSDGHSRLRPLVQALRKVRGDQSEALREGLFELAEATLDFVDIAPERAEAALREVVEQDQDGTVRRHLQDLGDALGPNAADIIKRVSSGPQRAL